MTDATVPRCRVAIVGGGSFGSAMARIIARAVGASPRFEPTVSWWVRRQAVADEINEQRTNRGYLGESALPKNLKATTDLSAAVSGAGVLVIAVPHEFLDVLFPQVRGALAEGAQVLSLVKGMHLEGDEVVPMSLRIARETGYATSMLAGPNLYAEMAQDKYAEATIGYAAGQRQGAELLREMCTTDTFGVELVADLVGVDLCAALKNVVAIACGLGSAAMGNVRSALIRRGHREIGAFCLAYFPSVEPATFGEACGIGDLMLTCSVGRGQRLAAAFVKAGGAVPWEELERRELGGMRIPDLHNLRAVHAFLQARGELGRFALLAAAHAVAFEGRPPAEVLAALRSPPPALQPQGTKRKDR